MSQIRQIARSALSQIAMCFFEGLKVKAVMPSEPSTPIVRSVSYLISITGNVSLSLLVNIVNNDVVSCGINDLGVILVEHVSLHVSFETEDKPTKLMQQKFTLVKVRPLDLLVASSVNLQPYFVIDQLRLMCCSFLSILFFLGIMKIN